jgi:hypothetical protein
MDKLINSLRQFSLRKSIRQLYGTTHINYCLSLIACLICNSISVVSRFNDTVCMIFRSHMSYSYGVSMTIPTCNLTYLVQYRTEVLRRLNILLGWLKDRAAIRTNLTLFISRVPSRQPPYKVHLDGVRRVWPFIVLRIRLDKIHPDFPKSIFHQ